MRQISFRPSHRHNAKWQSQRYVYHPSIYDAKIMETALKVLAISGCVLSYILYDNFSIFVILFEIHYQYIFLDYCMQETS